MSVVGDFHQMDYHEKLKIRSAAFRATRIYPGAVGQILSKELLAWEDFGYRLGSQRLINRLVHELMTTPMPPTPPTPMTPKPSQEEERS